ncbi:hypothetical protein Hamer_G007089 [Homarus americanus]|uniref:Uncharacterized protein n=1 Tax=Homarus americanus TaxID=6706 RepID=A0A8J5JWV1_HOMAM|nr:hypothetical protein Hamer_G007089 [Homarus americanus]
MQVLKAPPATHKAAVKSDPELLELVDSAVSKEEAGDLPVCYYSDSVFLMKKFRPTSVPAGEDWHVNRLKLYYSREAIVCVMETQEPQEQEQEFLGEFPVNL